MSRQLYDHDADRFACVARMVAMARELRVRPEPRFPIGDGHTPELIAVLGNSYRVITSLREGAL